VRDGVGFFFLRDFNHALGDERPCDAGAKKVLSLVNRAGLDDRINKIAREFFLQVINVNLGGAGLDGLLFEAAEFSFLADVGAERSSRRCIFP